jgi:transglutaminase-like putative cysteine protease
VRESFNEVRLRPVSNEHQTLENFLLKVIPASRLRHYTDFYSNYVSHFDIPEPHTSLLIESRAEVTTRAVAPLAEDATPAPMRDLGAAVRTERCYDFLQPSRYVDVTPESWRRALDATQGTGDTWQAALAIMRFVYGHLAYVPNSTHVHTHMDEAWAQREGVCQDYAHVMIGLCRALKIPALYVSGYLATETANATHAWMELFLPGLGWRGLDPTHNRQVNDSYVKLAVGRDYADVPPVAGHYKGTLDRRMEVEVKVRPRDSLVESAAGDL